MYQTILYQSEITQRLGYNIREAFVSDRFLYFLYEALAAAENDPTLLFNACDNALSTYNKDLDKIRWELARCPVQFTLFKAEISENSYDTYRLSKPSPSVRLEGHGQAFRVYPSHYEKGYLPKAISEYHNKSPVWFLYSPHQASGIHQQTPYWAEDNSLVDWLIEFVASDRERKVPRIVRQREHGSIGVRSWALYRASVEPSTDTGPDEALDSTEQIYHFIQENQPVSTGEILAQKFVKRSHTHRILKSLEAADRIEKAKHGIYIAI